MPLPPFDPDALTAWVMGPGVGELVVVRAPPGKWLVVDGCSVQRAGAAEKLLKHYGARPDAILFSHPHLDHARGLHELIQGSTRSTDADWPRLGMLLPPQSEGAGDLWDRQRAQEAGVVEQVVATILDRWEQRPSCRWPLTEGASEPLGAAVIEVLSPSVQVVSEALMRWQNGKQFDANRLATAVLVRWESRSVLLGSDLPEKPGAAWSELLAVRPSLATNDLYKVAHHGSSNAIGPQVTSVAPTSEASWIATPFASQGLPRFDADEGVDRHLRVRPALALTALPRAHAAQRGQGGAVLSRAQLAEPAGVELDPPAPGFPDCFVMATLRRDGPPQIAWGPGSLCVVP